MPSGEPRRPFRQEQQVQILGQGPPVAIQYHAHAVIVLVGRFRQGLHLRLRPRTRRPAPCCTTAGDETQSQCQRKSISSHNLTKENSTKREFTTPTPLILPAFRVASTQAGFQGRMRRSRMEEGDLPEPDFGDCARETGPSESKATGREIELVTGVRPYETSFGRRECRRGGGRPHSRQIGSEPRAAGFPKSWRPLRGFRPRRAHCNEAR